MLSSGEKVLPYFIERYRKGEKSKIQIVFETIAELHFPKVKAYGLWDSWFINKYAINSHFETVLKTMKIV